MKRIKEDKQIAKEHKKTDAFSKDKNKSFADKHSPKPSDNVSVDTGDKKDIDPSSAEGSQA